MNKVISYGAKARNNMVEGATMMKEIVASTLGPAGHNVVINEGGVRPLITKDGATVGSKVDSDDPYLKIGIQMTKDVVSKVDSIAGDGSTTTTIYFVELLEKLTDLVNLGVNPNDLRKGMDLATKDAVAILQKNAVHDFKVEDIAKVSVNGDPEMAKLIAEAYDSVGDDGTVILADSYSRFGKSRVEVSSGIKWAGGIPDSVFITNTITDTAEIENPYILVLGKGLTDLEPLMPYADLIKKKNKNLVIVAPYFDSRLCSTAKTSGIYFLMAPNTSFSNIDVQDALSDLAITVGTVVVPDAESAIQVVPDLKDLGVAKYVKASVKETDITQVDELDEKKAKAYMQYVKAIKKQIDDDDELQINVMEALRERLARLTGGIATIYIGSLTPTEKEEKVALFEDAQNSVSSAFKYGVLPGGGTALLKVAQILSNSKKKFETDAVRKGYEAVLDVMRKPAKILVKSVKPEEYQMTVQQVAADPDFWTGYNVRTMKMENLKETKILDSAAIEIFALQFSASEVGAFIISDGVIVNKTNNVNYDVNDRRVMEA